MEIKIDEKQIAEAIINELKRHSFIDEKQDVTIIYNLNQIMCFIYYSEVAKLLKCNTNYVYELIRAGLLPRIKAWFTKVTHSSLMEFLKNTKTMI